MPPSEKDLAYLWDMLEAAKDIYTFTKDHSFEDFTADKKTRFAVERQLLVIGEAANHVSMTFQEEYPEIPWNKIVGQRNILAHEYGYVLAERVWLVATKNIPDLIKTLKKIVPPEE